MLKDKLRAARTAAGLTQEQLADNSGVSLASIKSFERGSSPCMSSYDALKKALPGLPALAELSEAKRRRDSSSDEWEIKIRLGDGKKHPYRVSVERVKKNA